MAEYDDDAHPRDEQGRFTSGGGGGGAPKGPKEWAKKGSSEGSKGGASVKEWAGGAKPGSTRAAKAEAKSASKDAFYAQAAMDSRGIPGSSRQEHVKEAAEIHDRAIDAHTKAAEAHGKAGDAAKQAHHEKMAMRAREQKSSMLTAAAHQQADAVGGAASGKGDLTGKREWVGKQTDPDKMEFEGQFAGHGKQTIDDHFHNGKPLEGRAEMHQRDIIEPAFEGKKTAAELGQAKPIAIMTMGGPASGKGVVLGKLKEHGLDTSKFVHVDPDEVKGKLPEYKAQVPERNEETNLVPNGGKTFIGAAAQVHEESSYVAKQIRDRAISSGYNVVIDGTGGNAEKFIQLIDHLKSKGYEVQVHHPHLDMEEGVKRALGRAERSGRHVPEKFIRQTYDSIAKAEAKIREAAGSSYVRYDAMNGHKRVSG